MTDTREKKPCKSSEISDLDTEENASSKRQRVTLPEAPPPEAAPPTGGPTSKALSSLARAAQPQSSGDILMEGRQEVWAGEEDEIDFNDS